MIHWMRADNFHTLGQWDQALANIDKYVQLLGWDADLHQIAADSWLGKGDAERSRKHAEEGLALVPQSIGCLCSLAAACPAAEAPQVCQRIEKLDDPESGFESVIDYLMSIEDLDLARAYAAELKQAFPRSELNSYYDEELAGAGSP